MVMVAPGIQMAAIVITKIMYDSHEIYKKQPSSPGREPAPDIGLLAGYAEVL